MMTVTNVNIQIYLTTDHAWRLWPCCFWPIRITHSTEL